MRKIYSFVLPGLLATAFGAPGQSWAAAGYRGWPASRPPAGQPLAHPAGTDPVSPVVEQVVSGKVTDEKGGGLPGVTVVVKGTSQGTNTDTDGNFRLTVPSANSVLVFSFVGYARQEIAVGSQASLTVSLVPDNTALKEVVVVGYGTQQRRDITSSVATIDMRDVGEQPANNPNQILQGRAPGVAVKQTSGAPGGEFQVLVRGIGSLGAGSDPLYVIDGLVVGTSVGQNLNPNDIASISILKDAASTAIYGARGSNGVVLITTKQAKEGKTTLSLSANYGIHTLPNNRRLKMLNGPDFAQFKKDIFLDRIRILENREPLESEVPIGYRFPEQTQNSTNWYDLIIHDNAPYSDLNLTAASGTGPIKALLSLDYYKEEGIIKETNYDRFSARTNLNGQLTKYLSFGLNLNGTYTRQKLADTGGRGGVIGSALLADPRTAAYNPDGSLLPYINGVDGTFGFPNPLYVLRNVYQRRNIADLLANTYLEVSFLKDFKFRSAANVRVNNNEFKRFTPSTIGLAVAPGTSGAPPRLATENDQTENLINYSLDQLLTYTARLGTDHSLNVLGGYTAQRETTRGLQGQGNSFPDDLVPFLGAASIQSSRSYEFGYTLAAAFVRANYSYKDKYLLSASYRREGSSRFGAQNKYGDFPAASVGWRLTDESFMPKFTWLSDLKFRGSWGVTGNNNIGNYPSLAFVTSTIGNDNYNYILGNSYAAGKVISSFANQNLKWEKSNQVDVGLDLALFSNRLVFTFDYYNKTTRDMLLSVAIPAVSGFNSSLSNIGKVRNQGVEIGADYRTSLGPVNLRTNANISFNRNRILAINGPNDALYFGEFYSGYNVQKVGRPVGMIYGYHKLGIFNTQDQINSAPRQDGAIPGSMIFQDTNGDGVVSYDTKDMVEIGNPNPAFTWGWTLAGDYKGFDFTMLFQGAQNFDIYRNIESATMNMDGVFNVQTKAMDRWRSAANPGPDPGDVHSQGGTSYFKWGRESSDRYVYDASYAWLKTMTIGYTLPKLSFLSNTRIFVTGNNLFLFTHYPGSNPDVASGTQGNNIDNQSYPVSRTFATGLNINF